VLERRAVVGGAAVTEEFHPGYRNSIASYVLSLLRPEIIRDLQLKRHGLSLIPFRGALDILSDGRTLLFTGEERHDRAEVARFSNRDYEAMGALRERLQRVGAVVRDQLLREPPDLGGGLDTSCRCCASAAVCAGCRRRTAISSCRCSPSAPTT
jgi:phytoene dehydrogenase-like protein